MSRYLPNVNAEYCVLIPWLTPGLFRYYLLDGESPSPPIIPSNFGLHKLLVCLHTSTLYIISSWIYLSTDHVMTNLCNIYLALERTNCWKSLSVLGMWAACTNQRSVFTNQSWPIRRQYWGLMTNKRPVLRLRGLTCTIMLCSSTLLTSCHLLVSPLPSRHGGESYLLHKHGQYLGSFQQVICY